MNLIGPRHVRLKEIILHISIMERFEFQFYSRLELINTIIEQRRIIMELETALSSRTTTSIARDGNTIRVAFHADRTFVNPPMHGVLTISLDS